MKHRPRGEGVKSVKKFDIEFKTKLLTEQAQFEQSNLELEKQTKELKPKNKLRKEERKLERRVLGTKLDNDDARFSSNSASEKPFLN